MSAERLTVEDVEVRAAIFDSDDELTCLVVETPEESASLLPEHVVIGLREEVSRLRAHPLRAAVEGVVAELERRAENADKAKVAVVGSALREAASLLRKALDQHPVEGGTFSFEDWCAVDGAMAFAMEYGSEERVDSERLGELRPLVQKAFGQAAAQHPPEQGEGGLSVDDRQRLHSIATEIEGAVACRNLDSDHAMRDARFLRSLADHKGEKR